MLIGISGFARSGKDTVCDILLHHGVVDNRYAFADPIKDMINILFGWGHDEAFGDKKETTVEVLTSTVASNMGAFISSVSKYKIDEYGVSAEMIAGLLLEEVYGEVMTFLGGTIEISPREVYQLFGTEVCRHKIHEDIWVLIAKKTDTVIPDVRFPNEADWLTEVGTIVHVVRNDAPAVNPHESEKYINDLHSDIVIHNNGTLVDLESVVMEAFGIEDTGTNRLFAMPVAGVEQDGAKEAGDHRAKLEALQGRIEEMVRYIKSPLTRHTANYDAYAHGYVNGMIECLQRLDSSLKISIMLKPIEYEVELGGQSGYSLNMEQSNVRG